MKLNQYIDHTFLSPVATSEEIIKLCEQAKQHQFYAVCVNGCYTELASEQLANSDVKIATVIGFPLGAGATQAKIKEAVIAVEQGADEIDMVINIGYLKDGVFEKVEKEISEIKEAIGNTILKVILETCYLSKDEILKAIEICKNANADFIKTSTGFGSGGANEEVVKLMLENAGDLKVKASGGIRDAETARKYVEMGVERLGTSSGVNIVTSKNSENNEHTY